MGRRCVLALAILLALCVSTRALDAQEALERQEQLVGVDELQRSARENGGGAEYGAGLDEGLEGLLDTGTREVSGAVRRAARSGALLMVVLLFCALAESVGQGPGKSGVGAANLAGALAVTAVAAADVNSLLGMGTGAIEKRSSFANVLLPAVAAVAAATGAVTGAAARQMAAALFSDLLISLINGLLVPLLYGYIAASVAQAALGREELKRMADLLKWVVTTLITITMIAFVSYLTASGVVAGTADAAAVKAARFAISGAIPVVGGILSDAAETVLASAGVLRGTVGVFGMVTVLGICLAPLLRMAVHYLAYKLVAALASAFGDGPVCALVDRLSSAFGLVLGMTGACCLLLLIALVSCVSVAAA